MQKEKRSRIKFSPKTSAIIVALSVLIIGESLWLLERLDKAATRKEIPALPSEKRVVTPSPKAAVILSSPVTAGVKVGETLSVEVLLKIEEVFASDGIDLILTYNPNLLEVIDEDTAKEGIQVKISPETPFKTVGRNFAEVESERVLVTLLDLESPSGVAFSAGEQLSLVTVRFKTLAPGKAEFFLESKIAEAVSGNPMSLAKENLEVSIREK